ncbi:putative NBD/HSP70 family sugar kinase [Kribbella rubisoli]|uniref:NBD/HSP70 family sugar kinase n=1 Tax=Kribbella rubisoli TaxID=3075929 RepID=A0A4Q7W325_9ACTN|nr:ROK family protein [Kribbella rubisoli]RZU03438.1 putative NBD/HSP70 family sugar kinase [Kribbella rubisoli]
MAKLERGSVGTRTANRGAVIAALLSGAGIDRRQLVQQTGLSWATVARIVDDLLADGLALEQHKIVRDGPGRPGAALGFNPRSGLVCGIDLGGTYCRMVIADGIGTAIIRCRDETPRDLAAAELASWIATRVLGLVERYGDGVPLTSVAIGLPGVVASTKDRVVGAFNLPPILGTTFVETVAAELGVPTIIDNDSNLALLGELHYGELPRDETVVLLSLGTGLGSAVAFNRQVLAGPEGLLGEFGRLRLPGRKERLRDLLSGAGLLALAHEAGHRLRKADEVFAEPDRFGGLVDEIHEALLHLVSIVALAYEPSTVVFTGGFSGAFSDSVLESVSAETYETVGVHSDLRRSVLGDSGGLLGAMAAALSGYYTAIGVARHQVASITTSAPGVVAQLDGCAVDPPDEEVLT